MSFSDAVANGFRNYAGFEGRARRSEYWWWVLFAALVGVATGILDVAVGTSDFQGERNLNLFNAIASLALFLPGMAVTVRRLHDTNHSGWWYLIAFTIIGLIPLLIWFCSDGSRGANKYGGDPKAREADAFGPAVAPTPAAASWASPPPAATPDKFASLERLAKLRDQGALTQAEFDAEKAKLLGA